MVEKIVDEVVKVGKIAIPALVVGTVVIVVAKQFLKR